MGFSFHQTAVFVSSNQKINKQLLFTIGSKKERRAFSKFIKNIQFNIPNIKINLSCFPRINDYHKYNAFIPNSTLRSEIVDLLTTLNKDGYFVVAEVSLTN